MDVVPWLLVECLVVDLLLPVVPGWQIVLGVQQPVVVVKLEHVLMFLFLVLVAVCDPKTNTDLMQLCYFPPRTRC